MLRSVCWRGRARRCRHSRLYDRNKYVFHPEILTVTPGRGTSVLDTLFRFSYTSNVHRVRMIHAAKRCSTFVYVDHLKITAKSTTIPHSLETTRIQSNKLKTCNLWSAGGTGQQQHHHQQHYQQQPQEQQEQKPGSDFWIPTPPLRRSFVDISKIYIHSS